ncbi:hypothetical protein [Deinococcus soli (ex Cha et al. 2016)]|uniref:Uncharacterized protein n=2 Tax=Deinococcus soli (ex Cha et al. 2016) TaxID=1309411 RepID=A0AAE4BL86_9DEIO|nr:hypothetical protein [Deinococcus soli (ex Cha et al. 2016)]MDR6218673.1 hypothetical protein [Deinococcus soli (ex Cha et al. 2016)]MDR6328470.1 hypothetical protein [Deinococcus soli (ex Cha et al. 2016)]MDR6753081.1 hypothetical protein [Deinococcus soli (ex Cha et al. 2016)]
MIRTHLDTHPGTDTLVTFESQGETHRAILPEWATSDFQNAAQANGGQLDLNVRNDWMLTTYRSTAGTVDLLAQHAQRAAS